MEAKIENGRLTIVIDFQEPTPSVSGKTLVVATTHGNINNDVVIEEKNFCEG